MSEFLAKWALQASPASAKETGEEFVVEKISYEQWNILYGV